MPVGKFLRSYHAWFLLIGLAVPLLAIHMEVQQGTAVAFSSRSTRPLPELCFVRRTFGRHCPTCGLTRSIVYLMHGRVAESFAIHRLGWLFFLLIVGQIPYRLWYLFKGRPPFAPNHRLAAWFWIIFVLVLILVWAFEAVVPE